MIGRDFPSQDSNELQFSNSNKNYEELTMLSCSLVCDCWFITAGSALAHLRLLVLRVCASFTCACFSQKA